MLAPEMTLPAALRDAAHANAPVRAAGVRNLAPALLAALRRPGPAYCGDDDHAEVAAVCRRLVAALDDSIVDVAGHAAIGLGTLGRAEVLERAAIWIALDRDDDDTRWLRQAAIIATSYVGVAARDRDRELAQDVIARLRRAWHSPHDDVRFQVALARVEVDDPEAEDDLVAALGERGPVELHAQIVDALARLPRVRTPTLEALARVLADEEDAAGPVGIAAATLLAAHDRAEGVPRLVAALVRRDERDDALEALASLGPAARAATEAIDGLVRRWWGPPITRVRAAYALCRIAPAGSEARTRADRVLRRWALHPRRAVRDAVEDARRALDGQGRAPP
jgi:hypothetical protein